MRPPSKTENDTGGTKIIARKRGKTRENTKWKRGKVR